MFSTPSPSFSPRVRAVQLIRQGRASRRSTTAATTNRAQPTDTDVLVRTEVRGRAEPVQLDYRLEKTPGEGAGWKIYNLNVMGVWLVETYRNQFTQEINTRGVDGLLASLAERNAAGDKK